MNKAGWRLQGLPVEAWRRLRSAPTRTISLSVATFLATVALVTAEASSVGDALTFRAESRQAGSGVAVIEALGAIDAQRCAAIGDESGIVGSGALATGTAVELRSAPGILVQTADVTSGLLSVWTATRGRTGSADVGWVVGSSLRTELGLNRGGVAQVRGGQRAVIGTVLPLGVRTTRADRWLISVVAPTGAMDECWVEFMSPVGPTELEYLTAAFADVHEASARPLLRANLLSRDTSQEIRGRLSRNGWAAFAIVICLLHLVAGRARRRERALYTVLGTSRIEHFLMSQIEVVAVVIVPAIVGCFAATTRWLLVDDVALAGSLPLRVAITHMAVGVACVVIVAPILALPVRIDRLYQELRSE